MWRFRLLTASLLTMPMAVAMACDFQYDPVSIPKYYRASGWTLPGTAGSTPSTYAQTYELPKLAKVPRLEVQHLSHEEYPYIIEFPAQEFILGNDRFKMRPMQAKATIVRYSIGAKIVAFSYSLIPVKARREGGHWVVESEAACIFTATYIDDKGDGIFRVLTPNPFTTELIPPWARRPRS